MSATMQLLPTGAADVLRPALHACLALLELRRCLLQLLTGLRIAGPCDTCLNVLVSRQPACLGTQAACLPTRGFRQALHGSVIA